MTNRATAYHSVADRSTRTEHQTTDRARFAGNEKSVTPRSTSKRPSGSWRTIWPQSVHCVQAQPPYLLALSLRSAIANPIYPSIQYIYKPLILPLFSPYPLLRWLFCYGLPCAFFSLSSNCSRDLRFCIREIPKLAFDISSHRNRTVYRAPCHSRDHRRTTDSFASQRRWHPSPPCRGWVRLWTWLKR